MTYDANKAVVLLSGGIDSSTCLALAADTFSEIIPVHFDYGQQTAELEQEMARQQREHLDEVTDADIHQMIVVDYKGVFSHFAEGVAEDGKDFDELTEEDGRSSGYVPMRNLHLIATGAAFADTRGAAAIFHGAQAGDEADYPDCRPNFMDRAAGAISQSLPDDRPLDLRVPLLNMGKPQVIDVAEEYGVNFKYTYSCYSEVEDYENPEPCGECPACVERAQAFNRSDVEDPYETEVTIND